MLLFYVTAEFADEPECNTGGMFTRDELVSIVPFLADTTKGMREDEQFLLVYHHNLYKLTVKLVS